MAETKLTFFAQGHEYSQPLALICFSATWCDPFEQMLSIYTQLALRYAGQLRVLKVDVDQQSALSSEFAVNEVPTLVLLAKEQALDRHIGALPLEALTEWVDGHLVKEMEKKHEK